MNQHCTLCGQQYWRNHVVPLPGDDRFCEACAIEACEQMRDRHLMIDVIVQSLVRRGFIGLDAGSFDDAMTQLMAVVEEAGEVARLMRRTRQGAGEADRAVLQQESVDLLITTVALAWIACGLDLGAVILAKLTADESRGLLHRGGPLRPM